MVDDSTRRDARHNFFLALVRRNWFAYCPCSEEDRWITIGKGRNGVPLVVVHTFRKIDNESPSIRIISARRATKNELKQYSRR